MGDKRADIRRPLTIDPSSTVHAPSSFGGAPSIDRLQLYVRRQLLSISSTPMRSRQFLIIVDSDGESTFTYYIVGSIGESTVLIIIVDPIGESTNTYYIVHSIGESTLII